ncbi:MAG: MBL fold metallo-hydrolase [Faecalibacterium sp.]|nr:MBL fold metallo-hydrolase [Faecalibacterium sp.]
MKITWLGQAGLLLESKGVRVIIDPYLSDSVAAVNPNNYRRVPVDERFLQIRPDVIVCTHNHLDHTDPETLRHYLDRDGGITVLAPQAAWQMVRQFGHDHNYVQFNRHTRWTHRHIRFTAVKAEHSDPHPIGVLVEVDGKVLYITGDTLYNTDIFADLPARIDAVFLPVNGAGNNMNMADAKAFCEHIAPGRAVPLHCGLFDSIDMNEYDYEPKTVPLIYEEIKL